ncbi:hypothetical protein F5Y03DRAFT_396686 [Xylaria venustula]|nr:hypothetical protein F5Y03DRAFT_396686 [Xylaria venustula]
MGVCPPEIQDHLWVMAHPVSLYASNYGFYAGSMNYRGHFKVTRNHSTLFLSTSSDNAFGNAVWLNSAFLGSWIGDPEVLISQPNLQPAIDTRARRQLRDHCVDRPHGKAKGESRKLIVY